MYLLIWVGMLLNIFILLDLIYSLSLLKYRDPSSLWQEVKYSSYIQDLHTLAIVNPFAQSNTETQFRASGNDVVLPHRTNYPQRSIMSREGDTIKIYMVRVKLL